MIIRSKPKPVLHLNLISKYYDMIESGEKLEEYRDIKPFYDRIFDEYGYIKISGKSYHCTEIVVCFSNGYNKNCRRMLWSLKHLEKSTGQTKWGGDRE